MTMNTSFTNFTNGFFSTFKSYNNNGSWIKKSILRQVIINSMNSIKKYFILNLANKNKQTTKDKDMLVAQMVIDNSFYKPIEK